MRGIKTVVLAVCAVALAAPLHAQIIEGEGTYQTFGDSTLGPNGSQQRFGDTTLTPRGSYQRFGDTTLGPDGSSFQRFGDTTIGSNGATSQTFGDTTIITGPKGQNMTCQRFGTQTLCN